MHFQNKETRNLKFMGYFKSDFDENFKVSDNNIIGEGNSGIVYKLKNLIDGKIYAVKMFKYVETIQCFMSNLQEVFALLRVGMLENPNVIKLRQVFCWSEEPIY